MGKNSLGHQWRERLGSTKRGRARPVVIRDGNWDPIMIPCKEFPLRGRGWGNLIPAGIETGKF